MAMRFYDGQHRHYCGVDLLAIADRGVEKLPDSWCAAVLMLSDAAAVRAIAAPIPAVAVAKIAWRRLSLLRLSESVLDMAYPLF
jgi:hypothetical protein